MDMQMKSSVFKLLMAAFALFVAIDANAITLSDTSSATPPLTMATTTIVSTAIVSAGLTSSLHSMSSSSQATWDSLP